MRTACVIIATLAVGTGCAPTHHPTASAQPMADPTQSYKAEDLAFLAGIWRTQETVPETEETWTMPRGGTLMGCNRVIADGKSVFFERLRIEPLDALLVYQAHPKGAKEETPFLLVTLREHQAIFTNPEHDFPQNLTYTRNGDSLTIDSRGPERSFRLEMKHIE